MIPLIQPLFPEWASVETYFNRSLKTGQLSNFGVCHDELVIRLKNRLKRDCFPCATGTAAIQLAIQSQFDRGSFIGIPDFTHVGTLQAVIAAGCEPIILPCNPQTWAIDTQVLADYASELDGVIVVAPFGYGIDFDLYDRICRQENLQCIYDLAGGWGLNPDTSNTICYSLHATKNFSCGEGGIVSFSNFSYFQKVKKLSNFDTNLDRSIASPYGSNLKLDELKCAVILAHLDQEQIILDRIKKKKSLIELYQKELEGYCIKFDLPSDSAPSLCVLGGMSAIQIEALSVMHGFVAKRYYLPLSLMPGLEEIDCIKSCSPYFNSTIALPSDIRLDQVKMITDAIKEIVG